MNEKAKILVVDDDPGFLQFLKEGLELQGFEPTTSSSGAEAFKRIIEEGFDLVVSDYFMPGVDGEKLYQLLKSVNSELADRIIFVTGMPFDQDLIRFFSSTKCTFLTKPLTLDELMGAMEAAGVRP